MIEKNNEIINKINVLLDNKFLYEIENSSKTVKLNKLAEIKYGKGLQASELTNSYKYSVYGGNGIIGTLPTYDFDTFKICISCRGAASGNVILTEPFSTISSNSLYLNQNDICGLVTLYLSLKHYGLDKIKTGSAQPQITIDNIKNIDLIIPERDIENKLFSLLQFQNSYYQKNKELTKIKSQLLQKYFD